MKHGIKRILPVLCLIGLLLPTAVWAALNTSHILLETDTITVPVDGECAVTVSCRDMKVCSYTGGIRFDPACLEVTAITVGDASVFTGAVTGFSSPEQANESGAVGFYAVHAQEASYTGGTLMTVHFRALAAGTAAISSYEDCDGTEAVFTTAAGHLRFTVEEEPVTGELLWGDVNGDGRTNTVDLQALYEYLSAGQRAAAMDEATFAALADCNADGAIDILDYQYLYKAIIAATADTPAAAKVGEKAATDTTLYTNTDIATKTDITTEKASVSDVEHKEEKIK